MTFAEYSSHYLLKRKDKISLSTYSTYKNVITHFMLPFLGDMRLQKINKETILEFCNWLDSLSCKRNPNKPISDRSKHMAFTYLSTMLKFAVSWGIITLNHCILLSPDERLKPNYRKRSVYEESDLNTLFPAYDKLPITLPYVQQKLAFYLTLITGMRRGEVMALKWNNISLEKNFLSICRSNSILDGKIYTGTTKTKSSVRDICFSTKEHELLITLRKLQLQYLTKKGYSNDDDWVFISIRNIPKNKNVRPLSPNAPYTFLQDMQIKHGLKKNSFHELRHTAGTYAATSGATLNEVCHMLGHTKVSTTSIYVHSIKSGQEQLTSKLSNFYDEIKSKAQIRHDV